ncbi:hypothetical protein JTE90_004155 [Oedothorax gibbosus]|uniref:Uncharacterized protein n=1 Tax=Oedothorax gibbosus TaxID=931172 RepID=A0AAV6TU26_9ARAC|nr:hypothetical protein JTE90_004155 [Oedothorax gibbosus]
MSFYVQRTKGPRAAVRNPSPTASLDNGSESDYDPTEIYHMDSAGISNTGAIEELPTTVNTQVRYNLRNRSVPTQLNAETSSIQQPDIVRWLDNLTSALQE